MSISTYSELKTAIAGWFHRSDLSSSLADFITLSESKFNRRLRTLEQETTFTATSPTDYEIARPTDFKAFIRLWRTSDKGEVFSRSLTEVVSGQAGGVSAYFAVNRNVITFDGTSEVKGTYYAKIPALSDAAPTNWLLTAYPDLYLWAGLSEAAFYTKDTNAAAMWTERTDALIKEINGASQRDKFSGPLRVTAR
jgi:hypothetical protein